MKNIFKINLFTYIFFILGCLSGFYKNMFIIYLILIIHELGHFIVMRLYNIDVYSINLYPYGGIIKSNILINTNSKKIFIISISGIIIQIILYFIMTIFNKINILPINYYLLFNKYNTYIILFNILPIYPLDGFKILNSIIEYFIPYKFSQIISVVINIIFIIMLFIYMYICKINNYVIITFLLINTINYIKELKYLFNKFYIERILYKFNYNGLVSVNNKEHMYKNKLNYINGLNEFDYLSLKYYDIA